MELERGSVKGRPVSRCFRRSSHAPAELFMDGEAFRPDGKSAATVLPAAFGLAGVNPHTYNGWGRIPYWNAFVAILEMRGKHKS